MNTLELWTLLRYHNQFFSVTFNRRTDKKDGSAPAGSSRTMLCRTANTMRKYKKGVISDDNIDAKDIKNAILTVWSVDAYRANLKKGMNQTDAAFNAWRCIDLVTVTRCSLVQIDDVDLPPVYDEDVHSISNEYRLDNMPEKEIFAK